MSQPGPAQAAAPTVGLLPVEWHASSSAASAGQAPLRLLVDAVPGQTVRELLDAARESAAELRGVHKASEGLDGDLLYLALRHAGAAPGKLPGALQVARLRALLDDGATLEVHRAPFAAPLLPKDAPTDAGVLATPAAHALAGGAGPDAAAGAPSRMHAPPPSVVKKEAPSRSAQARKQLQMGAGAATSSAAAIARNERAPRGTAAKAPAPAMQAPGAAAPAAAAAPAPQLPVVPLPAAPPAGAAGLAAAPAAAAVAAARPAPRGAAGQFAIRAAGTLVLQEGWHTASYIYPAGFRSVKYHGSSVQLDQKVEHECTIVANGRFAPGPTFRVVAADRPNEPLEGKTPSEPWTAVRARVNAAYAAANQPIPKTRISGPHFFGLTKAEGVAALEAIDPEHQCAAYWAARAARGAQPAGGAGGAGPAGGGGRKRTRSGGRNQAASPEDSGDDSSS